MTKIRRIKVTQSIDGSLQVHEFPEMIALAPELLCYSPLMETIITIRAANGEARYQVCDIDSSDTTIIAKRLDDAR